jgi:nucleoside-diphosphate-sugar epimerase
VSAADGLTVAVTGPTGDIGKSVVRALERAEGVERIIGMARRPFDPAEHGWRRATYRRGDVLDRASVDELVRGAEVVVHLAFIIFGSREETHRVNLEGSRNVFEAAAAAPAERLVYASSVAAYGFPEGEAPLTEADEPRGTDRLYYSAQKAELESALREAVASSTVEAYVFRPCIVAGADAPTLITKAVGAVRLGGRLRPLGRVLGAIPGLKPVLPDNGVPFQLVHHDDVAAAIAAAVTGAGPAGAYNLAGPGELTAADLARELGWRSVRVPRAAVTATAEVLSRVPRLPPEVAWLNALRAPVLMDTSRARRELGWEPRRDALATLRETVAGARESGLL